MKKYYKVILSIPMIALALWGINYYGNNYSHTEEYFKCDINLQVDNENHFHGPTSMEYLRISRWFYGSDISVRLQNLIAYFPYEDCKENGEILRCFSHRDSGATNLTFNLNTNEGKASIRKKSSAEIVTNYEFKCELQK